MYMQPATHVGATVVFVAPSTASDAFVSSPISKR